MNLHNQLFLRAYLDLFVDLFPRTYLNLFVDLGKVNWVYCRHLPKQQTKRYLVVCTLKSLVKT